jgi:hypothetical protein
MRVWVCTVGQFREGNEVKGVFRSKDLAWIFAEQAIKGEYGGWLQEDQARIVQKENGFEGPYGMYARIKMFEVGE